MWSQKRAMVIALAAVSLLCAAGGAAGEVRSATLGITMNCPYGLAG